MKKSSVILVILLLLVALLVWWRWLRVHSVPEQTVAKSKATAPTAPKSPGAIAREQKELEVVRELAEKSNKPIQFYGLVLDQDYNPVPGVKVTFSVRATKEPAPGMIRDEFDYPVVNSDAGGRFALVNAKGALLSVKSLEKAGYEASEKSVNRAHYWYWSDPRAVFHPDPLKPEVFRMWKKAGAEVQIVKGIGYRIPCDGTPTEFDLLEGRPVKIGGDLRVMLARYPLQIAYGQRNYEWTATIAAVDGGLIESTQEQMYRAPVDGYQSQIVIHMSADDPQWTDMKDIAVYLKLRGGKYYGRVQVELSVGSDRPTTPVYVRSFVNPNGSRNLEYDPMQVVNKEPSRIKQ